MVKVPVPFEKEYTIISAARSMWLISTWLNLEKEMLVLPL